MSSRVWSTQQKSIFNWFIMGRGNALVRARAGCGKSSTIIEGLNRANSSSTLYSVFNKKNKEEASEKIKNSKVTVKTLHGVGYSWILKNWRGVRASEYAEWARIKLLYPECPKQVIFQTDKLVSLLKNLYVTPTEKDSLDIAITRGLDGGNHAVEGWDTAKISKMALEVIALSLEFPKNKLISFNDMVFLPVSKNWVKPQYNLLCVDEAQDSSSPQMEMIIRSCNPNGRICIVGDDRQNLYSWRGTLLNGLDLFKEKLSAKEFPLNVTYRCPKRIVSFAQLIVPDITAHESAIEGEVVTINQDKMLADIKVKDSVLSRLNYPLVKICLALIRKGKAAYVEGREIGKMLADIVEEIDAKTVNEFYDKLQIWEANKIQRATGWFSAKQIELINDQVATLRIVAESCLEMADIFSKLNKLFMDADYVKVPSVVCSSVHRAKGLEWDNCYLLSETFNRSRQGQTEQDKNEESNIYYTAITRSRNKLAFVSLK